MDDRGLVAPGIVAAGDIAWMETATGLRVAGPVPQGEPVVVDGDLQDGSALLRWAGTDSPDSTGTAAAVNYRIPIPRLRRLAATAPAVA